MHSRPTNTCVCEFWCSLDSDRLNLNLKMKPIQWATAL